MQIGFTFKKPHPIKPSSDSKKGTNYEHFGHRSKSFIVADPLNLMITKNDQPSFETFHTTIIIVFDYVHPFTTQSLFCQEEEWL